MMEWRTFSKKIDKLSGFYRSMRKNDIRIGTFDFVYNNVVSHVIFDTSEGREWGLYFIKHGNGNGETLEIPIAVGYKFEIRSYEKYLEFRKYFEISGVTGTFHFEDFIPHINNNIPNEYVLNDNKRVQILKYNKLDRNSAGIYPVGVINWEEVHLKNPNMDPSKYHRTEENLRKTRELYPSIYSIIRDKDISIRYGEKKEEKTENIILGICDWCETDGF